MRATTLLCGALLLAAPVLAQSAPVQPPPQIVVAATGEERIVPDRARISIGVQTQALTAAEAAAANDRLQRAVIDTLKALGITNEQLSTTGYNVYPDQQYDEVNKRSRIVGYNVQNTLVVEVRRITQVGAVLDAALSKGANLISSLSFYASEMEAPKRRAMARAVERARADAETLARAAGGRLGALLELSSFINPVQPLANVRMTAARAEMADAQAAISEGSQIVFANVTARWQFVPGQ
jgi:uncharacterized protein YggE